MVNKSFSPPSRKTKKLRRTKMVKYLEVDMKRYILTIAALVGLFGGSIRAMEPKEKVIIPEEQCKKLSQLTDQERIRFENISSECCGFEPTENSLLFMENDYIDMQLPTMLGKGTLHFTNVQLIPKKIIEDMANEIIESGEFESAFCKNHTVLVEWGKDIQILKTVNTASPVDGEYYQKSSDNDCDLSIHQRRSRDDLDPRAMPAGYADDVNYGDEYCCGCCCSEEDDDGQMPDSIPTDRNYSEDEADYEDNDQENNAMVQEEGRLSGLWRSLQNNAAGIITAGQIGAIMTILGGVSWLVKKN